MVSESGSPKAVAASSKATPCLAEFALALSRSHSNFTPAHYHSQLAESRPRFQSLALKARDNRSYTHGSEFGPRGRGPSLGGADQSTVNWQAPQVNPAPNAVAQNRSPAWASANASSSVNNRLGLLMLP